MLYIKNVLISFLRYSLYLSMSTALILAPAQAGKLKKLEKEVSQKVSISSDNSNFGINLDSEKSNFFIDLIFAGLAFTGSMSNQRANSQFYSPEELIVTPRHTGEAGLPFARLDLDSHYVTSDIETFNYRMEAGYGAIAASISQSYVWIFENGQTDKLRLEELLLLYRMSFGSMVEIDLGLGRYQVRDVDVDNSIAFSLPIIFHPSDYFGLEFRLTWSFDGAVNHELSVLSGWDYFKFRAGYRWIEINDVDLNGPFIGITAHY